MKKWKKKRGNGRQWRKMPEQRRKRRIRRASEDEKDEEGKT